MVHSWRSLRTAAEIHTPCCCGFKIHFANYVPLGALEGILWYLYGLQYV